MKNISLTAFLYTGLFLIILNYQTGYSQNIDELTNWKNNYNFDQNIINSLSVKLNSCQPVTEVNSNTTNLTTNNLYSGIHQLEKKVTSILNSNFFEKKYFDNTLSNDTLIIGVPPNDSLIIDSDYTYNGTILIALNGLLKFKNAKATIKGDIILFNNGRLEIENSKMYFPQRYFYERTIFATGNSSIQIKNSSMDYSGLSHTLASVNNAKIEIENITNNGFTTTGLYGSSTIFINGSNEAGEFVIKDSCRLNIKNAKTALLWHHLGRNEKFDVAFPSGDTVMKYECKAGMPGVSGISYHVLIDTCRDVMWALMPANGCDIKIKDSKLRAIGLWTMDFSKTELNGLVNNSKYDSYTLPFKDIGLTLTNTSVMTWSVYTMDNSDITLTGSIVGEVGAENRSKVTCSKMFCDGTGGYMWGTDTTFTVIGFSSATTSVRSQGNGIVVLAYSALTMGQATAVQNSVLMVLQSSIPEEPVPYDNACVWYGNLEKPSIANVNSKVAIIGSAWLLKTVSSKLMDFGHYNMYYRHKDTDNWIQIPGLFTRQVRHDTLAVWNTTGMVPDNYQIRVVISDNIGDSVEAIRSINLLPADMEVGENLPGSQFELYPNPADDYIICRHNGLNNNVYIYNIFGEKCISNYDLHDSEFRFNTGNLSNGLYFLQFNANDKPIVKKFLINRK